MIGRWGKVDPLGENHFDKSPYNYVLNNPICYVDPFGLDTVDYNSLRKVMQGDDIRLKDGSIALNSLPDVNVFGGENNQNSAFVSGLIAINEFNPLAHFVDVVSYGFTGRDRFGNAMNAIDAYAGVFSVIPIGKVAGVGLAGVSKVAGKTVEKNFGKISDNLLRRSGIDAHQLKRDFLGNKAKISHYDLYKDTKSGEILIIQKGGKGTPIQTGEFIK